MGERFRSLALYYNADCPKCALIARRTAQFDWLGRVELLTGDSPAGSVPAGEIVVVDRRRGQLLTGIFATRRVCLHVPAFFVFGLLLKVPFVSRAMSRQGAVCAIGECTPPDLATDTAGPHA